MGINACVYMCVFAHVHVVVVVAWGAGFAHKNLFLFQRTLSIKGKGRKKGIWEKTPHFDTSVHDFKQFH